MGPLDPQPQPDVPVGAPGPSTPHPLEMLAQDANPTRTVQPPSPIDPPPAVPGPGTAQEAIGGGLAARMRAKAEKVRRKTTEDFPVPGWDGDLVVRARLMDEPTVEAFTKSGGGDDRWIVDSTAQLLARNDAGELEEVPGGWGPTVAEWMALPPDTPPTRLVSAALNDAPFRIQALALDILNWNRGKRDGIEVILGE